MTELESLTKKRGGFKSIFTRHKNWLIDNVDEGKSSSKYEVRLTQLETAFANYTKVQNEILLLKPDDTDIEQYEDLFLDIIAVYKDKIVELDAQKQIKVQSRSPSPVLGTSTLPTTSVRLPDIQIKPFTGDLVDWISFSQLFTALIIDNVSLTDIERLAYLKTSVKNEPLKLIDSLAVTHQNFDLAWNILKNRYENKNSLINHLLVKFFEISTITKCNATTIREFVTSSRKILDSIKNLGLSFEELYNIFIVYNLERKLDFGTKRAFETERQPNRIATPDEFLSFLEKRCVVMENINSLEGVSSKKSQSGSFHTNNQQVENSKDAAFYSNNQLGRVQDISNSKNQSNTSNNFKPFKCSYCSEAHKIYACVKFKNLQTQKKRDFAQTKKLCFNCLASNHSKKLCMSKSVCSVCQQKHHTWLHLTASDESNVENSPAVVPNNQQKRSNGHETKIFQNSNNNNNNSQVLSTVSEKTSHVLLATASVYVYNKNGVKTRARILLDNGSQNSFMTESFLEKIKLPTYTKNLNISGIGQKVSATTKMIDVTLHSNVSSHKFKVSCAVLPQLTCNLPQVKLDVSKMKLPSNLKLADPNFDTPGKVDILIGADLYYEILLGQIKHLGKNMPVLQNTYFGYVVAGKIPSNLCANVGTTLVNVSLYTQNINESSSLEKMIERFWTIEETPSRKVLAPEEIQAEKIFCDTTKILEDGRYQVDLPFKSVNEPKKLGDSFHMAKTRFLNLEKKFQKNVQYRRDYTQFIEEYVELGHGRYVPLSFIETNSNDHKYFLPHHAVIKESSVSTKIRVVFDASARSSSGISLNDVTLKGFQVQPDLYDILCRFRFFNFVLCSDIQKMFRQIKVNPEHCYLQNILWRSNPDEDLKCIELSTITYGTNCAPYLATRAINHVAERNAKKFPLASTALLSQTYVDDIITGCDTAERLIDLYQELNQILNAAGFQLHKWCSNSFEFLQKISQPQTSVVDLNLDDLSNSVLGLKWNPHQDDFIFTCPETLHISKLTKRKILSIIAQIYDPLGLVSCIIVSGKLIMQKLWMKKLDWDTEIVDLEIISLWNSFVKNILYISELKIPRNLFLNKTKLKIQLHGFADSSMVAYAACIYVRTLYSDGSVSSSLISSKSRVAPIKQVSLPRLELCAMLLLSRLITKIIEIFKNQFTPDSVHLWSDSTIALNWIQSHSSRWVVFVANRVAEIQTLTSQFTWRHVISKDNPADLPSRGCSTREINNSSLWLHGPSFLLSSNNFNLKPSLNKIYSPKLDGEMKNEMLNEERKVTLISLQNAQELFWENLFTRFSSFSRLQRTLAYCFRFIDKLKRRKIDTNFLSVQELDQSLLFIVKILQRQNFKQEFLDLKNKRILSNKNLLSLKLFVSESDDLIRVGGRLENAEVPFNQKHPILLPSHNDIVALMLKAEHVRLGHAGAQTVLSNFRLNFWPLNGLKEVKRVIRKCVTCYRFRAQPSYQIMADLPQDRVQVCRPFQKSGVDFGGPFLIRASRLRKAPIQKCYIAIFVCMVTKAVHIELVSSLTTEAFIACFKRFVSRRGNPAVIYSDNGTNFLGAKNQLFDLYNFFNNTSNEKQIQEYFSLNYTQWKFIPPRSPHWGGIWEAAIKSAKFHMVRIIGNSKFTFEELATIVSQIEAILNSRPLSALSSDPNDLRALTPGHFLIGTSLTALPDKEVSNVPENKLSYWNQCVQIQQTFWKRWTVEYLNRLQQRPKWLLSQRELQVNDIVLVKDGNESYPLKWPLARIIETILGPDGKVRVVVLRTSQGTYKRSITKICPLPGFSSNSDVN